MTDLEQRITTAIRERNAALNSYRRAENELRQIIPEGVVVFHRRPGETTNRFWVTLDRGRSESAGRREDFERDGDGIIIEAPCPREEYLPRLNSKE